MYKEVLFYFLRLGVFGFGGPLAVITTMQKDLVEKRRWMTPDDFSASFSLIKAMPGPVAFQTAVFLGRMRAGFWGGALAAFGIVFPAFVMMILFSLFFNSLNQLSFTHHLMQGMQVAALGVILGSLKGLAKSHFKKWFFWVLIIISGMINFYSPALEPVVIISFGLMMVLLHHYQFRFYNLAPLFMVCFKAGALVFGTGLAIVPMLSHDVVEVHHWLSQSEFLNALAFGQLTPGPVVITATYIGHKVAGFPGAIVATFGIFIAAFFHMSTWFPRVVLKLSGKVWIQDFIFGAVAAVIGPIIVAVMRMSLSIEPSMATLVLGLIAFALTILDLVPVWIIIPCSGIIKIILSAFSL